MSLRLGPLCSACTRNSSRPVHIPAPVLGYGQEEGFIASRPSSARLLCALRCIDALWIAEEGYAMGRLEMLPGCCFLCSAATVGGPGVSHTGTRDTCYTPSHTTYSAEQQPSGEAHQVAGRQ